MLPKADRGQYPSSLGTISIISWGLLKTAQGQVLEEFLHQPATSNSDPQLPWGQAHV